MWDKLPRPFFALAPMEEVTDTVFRQLICITGKPDVFFTEFMSVEGYMSKGRLKVAHRLDFTPQEKPLIAQIWGLKPEFFLETAKALHDLGFDGIDINMGCPKNDVVRRGTCAGLIRNPSLAAEIIAATKEGAGTLPVSVKTRIGHAHDEIDTWIAHLLHQNLAALTVHMRTVKELSKVPAHWDFAPRITALKKEIAPSTVLIGNGDILTKQQGKDLTISTGFDGIMIGRGVFNNLWVFNDDQHVRTKEERLSLLLTHARLFVGHWGKSKNFHILKRYFKIYVSDFDGAVELREKLMRTENLDEVQKVMEWYNKQST